jgi:hypothetical protein
LEASALSWLKNTAHRPEYVTIIDLPETLIFADALLRHEVGIAEVRYLLDDTPIDPAGVGAKVLLCPISNVSALRRLEFDLVTNTLSMQEMTDEWVDWYMRWLDMQPCRYFYSANFFGTALARMREGRNSWSPRPSSGWWLQHSGLTMTGHAQWQCRCSRREATQVLLRAASRLGLTDG